MDFSQEDLFRIAATTYAEMGNESKEAKINVISSILNRVGESEWQNKDLKDILSGGYYGTKGVEFDGNAKYKQGLEILHGSEKYGKDNVKELIGILHLVHSLSTGNMPKTQAQYFLTDEEAKKNKSWLKNTLQVGNFKTKSNEFKTYARKDFIGKKIQTRINELGGNLTVDGIVGKNTKKAISDFQSKKDQRLNELLGYK